MLHQVVANPTGKSLGDDFLKPDERTPADEEDVGRVESFGFVMRVVTTASKRNVDCAALDHLENGLLDTLATNIPSGADVLRFGSQFVEFVDVDDASLGCLNVIVCGSDQIS